MLKMFLMARVRLLSGGPLYRGFTVYRHSIVIVIGRLEGNVMGHFIVIGYIIHFIYLVYG